MAIRNRLMIWLRPIACYIYRHVENREGRRHVRIQARQDALYKFIMHCTTVRRADGLDKFMEWIHAYRVEVLVSILVLWCIGMMLMCVRN